MRVQSYYFKPDPKFYGKGEYFLGVELEVEAPDYSRRERGLDILKRPGILYAKHDGSLNSNGWEIVTHPISAAMWLERNPKKSQPVGKFINFINDLKGLGYTSHDNARCGLHIHISRTVFERPHWSRSWYNDTMRRNGTTVKTSRFYWFKRLINGVLFRRLSQRKSGEISRWCAQSEVNARTFHSQCGRYVACNVTDKTVEVRIFRGNMREDRIRKAVEAVIAAVEFSKTLPSRNFYENLEGNFVKYILANKAKYRYLAAYLEEIGVIGKPVEICGPMLPVAV